MGISCSPGFQLQPEPENKKRGVLWVTSPLAGDAIPTHMISIYSGFLLTENQNNYTDRKHFFLSK